MGPEFVCKGYTSILRDHVATLGFRAWSVEGTCLEEVVTRLRRRPCPRCS